MSSHAKSAKAKSFGKNRTADQRRLERGLEEGLKGTFPASDAVAVLDPAPYHEDDKPNDE